MKSSKHQLSKNSREQRQSAQVSSKRNVLGLPASEFSAAQQMLTLEPCFMQGVVPASGTSSQGPGHTYR